MILTEEFINIVTPEHSRTSCSDDNLSNAFAGSSIDGIIYFPRCYRCFLMDNIGYDTINLEFKVSFSVDLEWK